MPRKAASKTAAPADEAAPASTGRRSTRLAERPAPPPAPPKRSRKKRSSEEKEQTAEDQQEEPAAKKAKADQPETLPAAVPDKPASKGPSVKPTSKASAKPTSASKPTPKAGSKPTSKSGASSSKPAADKADPPATIPEEEMEEKETTIIPDEKAAEEPAKELQLGDKLPDWTFKNEKDEDVVVGQLAGEKGLVIFLVPKADTPGCTTQACGFRDIYSDFEKYGYAVYGLSKDKSAAQSKWQTKQNLPYSLISDPTQKLIAALGAKSGAATKRSHVIFEKGSGKLVEKKLGVKPIDSPKQALEFIKKHHPDVTA